MRLIYDLGIWFYGILLRIISPFHAKAKLWVEGRKDILLRMEQTIEKGHQHIWFHFASLGEFEQGRAVMERIKKSFPQERILLTFFSPSGFEVRKNTVLADYVFYLPEDTASNASRFVDIIDPKFAVFTKYEYWYHYFNELHKRRVRLLMISAIFREEQIFFKPYGGFFKGILRKVSYFFVQNTDSVHMLKWIGITNAGLSGDTRFDRVIELPKQHQPNLSIESFIGNHKTIVAGSTWKPDEELLACLLAQYSTWKMILAPHEIHIDHIASIQKLFPTAILFSRLSSYTAEEMKTSRVLVMDNIGMLSSLYYYGQLAYIGGGFGAGIHNTLEAATYGIPVIFGPRYEKFKEAEDLITIMAGFSVSTEEELIMLFEEMQDLRKREASGRAAKKYVQQNAGATQIIMKYLQTERLLK